MTQTETRRTLEHWLSKQLPGGKYILPHWDDGPYYLVPVLSSTDANWQARVVLDAHTPLTERLWIRAGWGEEMAQVRVYALSQFCTDTLTWHESEYELELHQDGLTGPYDTRPGPAELIAALDQIIGLPKPEDRSEEMSAALTALRATAPTEALAALTTITKDTIDNHVDDTDPMEMVLTTAAAVATHR